MWQSYNIELSVCSGVSVHVFDGHESLESRAHGRARAARGGRARARAARARARGRARACAVE